MMNIEQNKIANIPEIIVNDMKGEASAAEIATLNAWLSESTDNRELYEKLLQAENLATVIREYDQINCRQAWENIIRQIDKGPKRKQVLLSYRIMAYAAVVLIPLAIAAYFLFPGTSSLDAKNTFAELERQVIQLKGSSLIMADGEIVDLHARSKESIVEVDGTQIAKEDSMIHYQGSGQEHSNEAQYNSLVTPGSRVFTVVLSDGTKVWLNASSAIKYPTRFNGDVRKVYLTGEAYFEVKRDTLHPFVVSTSNMEVVVLGTVFNVMAYPDEKVVQTTLLSGKVKVKTSNSEMVLRPGMQAQLNKEKEALEQRKADTDVVSSWRFGKYIFKYEDMESVVSKLSRWYNVEISILSEEAKSRHFSGTLYKYNDIDKTLRIIELATDVKFSKSGDKIVVNKRN